MAAAVKGNVRQRARVSTPLYTRPGGGGVVCCCLRVCCRTFCTTKSGPTPTRSLAVRNGAHVAVTAVRNGARGGVVRLAARPPGPQSAVAFRAPRKDAFVRGHLDKHWLLNAATARRVRFPISL